MEMQQLPPPPPSDSHPDFDSPSDPAEENSGLLSLPGKGQASESSTAQPPVPSGFDKCPPRRYLFLLAAGLLVIISLVIHKSTLPPPPYPATFTISWCRPTGAPWTALCAPPLQNRASAS